MENTKAIVQEFASHLRNVKNRSELTVSAYLADIRQFCRILGVEDFSEVTRRDVESKYISALVKDGISPASRARKLSSLKCFFKWAKANEIVECNPVELIDPPKLPHRAVKVMQQSEVEDVMVAAKCGEGSEATAFRDIAILSLMFGSGLRRAEVANAKLNDLNLEDGSLTVWGKGSRQRKVYFGDGTRAILSEYAISHRQLLKKAAASEYLFPSRQGEKMSVATINNIVNKYFTAAGVKQNGYTAHSTRKFFASEAFKASGNILAVARCLGHSNTQTTLLYIGQDEDSKRAAACAVNF